MQNVCAIYSLQHSSPFFDARHCCRSPHPRLQEPHPVDRPEGQGVDVVLPAVDGRLASLDLRQAATQREDAMVKASCTAAIARSSTFTAGSHHDSHHQSNQNYPL